MYLATVTYSCLCTCTFAGAYYLWYYLYYINDLDLAHKRMHYNESDVAL